MPTLYRDTGYSLTHLIEDIKHGNVALPDIQRPFVWPARKARELFDSMYRGYPVGTLMFWETGAAVGTKQFGAGKSGETGRVPKLLVVDGQQRLTSLYAVLTGSEVVTKTFQSRRIKIAFRPADETFEVADASIERDPEFIADITDLWIGSFKSRVREFMTRLETSRDGELSQAEQDQLEERIDRVRDLRDFRFQVIELNSNADEEQVADIFVRINSEGVQLKQADFILTLMSVHWEKGRRQLEQFARDAVVAPSIGPSPKNPFINPGPDQLLRAAVGLAFKRGRLANVYSILRGKDLESGQVSEERRAAQFEALARAQDQVVDLTNWHEFLKCVQHAGFRSDRMIASDNALIYTYTLWLVGRHDFGIERAKLRKLIARWFFMAHTTGRYTSSPESVIEADLTRFKNLPDSDAFTAELNRQVRSNFTGDYWDISLPNRLDTSAAKSPVLSAYWAALNLLDAEVLFSHLKIRDLLDPAINSPRSMERHHLFPKAFLKSLGVSGVAQTNAIANMAFLDWPENATIGSGDPREYWPEMSRTLNPEMLKRQVYWHALPVGWEQLEYSVFLERRRSLIAKVVRDGFDRLWEDRVRRNEVAEIAEIIASGESQLVEFKSTARWNLYTGKPDRKMEQVIAKTVCGFLNGEGGTLIIGVDDDGNVLGLERDMSTLGAKGNPDGFELALRQMLDNSLSVSTAGLVRIRFETLNEQTICVVSVAPSGKAVFAKSSNDNTVSNFWVRIGNATKQLHGDDLIQYRDDHWGTR
ncbi:DUF262 domain-containing protein [Hoyosella rhizosphaerae]|uniref:DUF262 domain-containing protein n=1 Tax=Hoyosella rhizosphaerae TaxID=1755582 RepID=A0A916UK47_9ACTN|nr:DUF262 domain-containing protein [Hoyosella rhizosphaerae]MBN4928292.1 DUF262 domain-containing protein [Hoyosella rhizosphaerae]GGC73867.1 hypothetical protein GCM10011410_28790 [Hoyosella rhizosphaerae]